MILTSKARSRDLADRSIAYQRSISCLRPLDYTSG